MSDLLTADGVALETVTPRSVIRAAFSARLISDGEAWMQALDARNRMSHTDNLQEAEKVVAEIRSTYLGLLDALHFSAMQRENDLNANG